MASNSPFKGMTVILNFIMFIYLTDSTFFNIKRIARGERRVIFNNKLLCTAPPPLPLHSKPSFDNHISYPSKGPSLSPPNSLENHPPIYTMLTDALHSYPLSTFFDKVQTVGSSDPQVPSHTIILSSEFSNTDPDELIPKRENTHPIILPIPNLTDEIPPTDVLNNIYSTLYASNAILVPISYYDILSAKWWHNINYRTLISYLHLFFHSDSINLLHTRNNHSNYNSQKSYKTFTNLSNSQSNSKPPIIGFLITDVPTFHSNNATSNFANYNPQIEEQKLIKTLLKQLLFEGIKKASKDFRDQLTVHVCFSKDKKSGDEFNSLVFPSLKSQPNLNLQTALNMSSNWKSSKLLKHDPIYVTNTYTTPANEEHNSLSSLYSISKNLFFRYKELVSKLPDEFQYGFDSQFGATCDEIIRTLLDAYDEEAERFESSLYKLQQRTLLLNRIIEDLQPKYEIQLSTLRSIIQNEFKKAVDSLPLTKNINKDLATLIQVCDSKFMTFSKQLQSEYIEDPFLMPIIREDLASSLREMAKTILQYARLNGLYLPPKPLRQPLTLSLHYLSPKAFGLGKISKLFKPDPMDLKYSDNPSALLTSGDPHIKGGTILDVNPDSSPQLKEWINSVVYKPSINFL